MNNLKNLRNEFLNNLHNINEKINNIFEDLNNVKKKEITEIKHKRRIVCCLTINICLLLKNKSGVCILNIYEDAIGNRKGNYNKYRCSQSNIKKMKHIKYKLIKILEKDNKSNKYKVPEIEKLFFNRDKFIAHLDNHSNIANELLNTSSLEFSKMIKKVINLFKAVEIINKNEMERGIK